MAQRISSASRRSVRSTICAESTSVAVQCSSIRAGQDLVGAQRALVAPHLADDVVHVEDRATAHQRVAEVDEARVPEPVRIQRGQVGGLAGEQEGAVERARRGAVDLVEGVAQAQLLDRRRHPRRDDAAHPAALDDERDPAPVGALTGLGALVAAAVDELDHRVVALVLGHRRRRAVGIGGEPLEDRQAHRCEGTVTRRGDCSVRPRWMSAGSASGSRRSAARATSTSAMPATWRVPRTSTRCASAPTRCSMPRLPPACATSTRLAPMAGPRSSSARGWASGVWGRRR